MEILAAATAAAPPSLPYAFRERRLLPLLSPFADCEGEPGLALRRYKTVAGLTSCSTVAAEASSEEGVDSLASTAASGGEAVQRAAACCPELEDAGAPVPAAGRVSACAEEDVCGAGFEPPEHQAAVPEEASPPQMPAALPNLFGAAAQQPLLAPAVEAPRSCLGTLAVRLAHESRGAFSEKQALRHQSTAGSVIDDEAGTPPASPTASAIAGDLPSLLGAAAPESPAARVLARSSREAFIQRRSLNAENMPRPAAADASALETPQTPEASAGTSASRSVEAPAVANGPPREADGDAAGGPACDAELPALLRHRLAPVQDCPSGGTEASPCQAGAAAAAAADSWAAAIERRQRAFERVPGDGRLWRFLAEEEASWQRARAVERHGNGVCQEVR